ncbi:orotidine-5'-phosphate decarboxylase [bacterium]|nr:orotidine-5'-phosphate decarboxylase [bacterium]
MNHLLKLTNRTSADFHVCVGLDSDFKKIPQCLKEHAKLKLLQENEKISAIMFSFNLAIIEATFEYVAAYKLNLGFYLDQGIAGIEALRDTCLYLKREHPEIFVILDSKSGDIGNTNLGYMNFIFNKCQADAVTVHNYMGYKAMKPFLETGKGVFVLCKTSNEGSEEFQGEGHYLKVAKHVASREIWNEYQNCGLVVGATYPDELLKVREVAPFIALLIPGIGKQGGALEATVKNAVSPNGESYFIVNSSRGIIFASDGEDYAKVAQEKTIELHKKIMKIKKIPTK